MIVLSEVGKVFASSSGTTYEVLREINLRIESKSFLCVLGPSGCGKTTILNLIAGFERPSRGMVSLNGSSIEGPSSNRAVVFQDAGAAVFPWLTVEENIAFGPRIRGLARDVCTSATQRFAKLVGLDAHLQKFPFELSGGMKQRVQIARALANDPEILLMDEPFAALDAINKKILQVELSAMWRSTTKTIVYITHDIAEAILLATDIAVMTSGPGATIKTRIPVTLPFPRSVADAGFGELQVHLEGLIKEEVQAER
jgi:NitT/TauT family transport system ATP-binding protein